MRFARRVLAILLITFAVGTLAGTMCWMSAQQTQILVDTTTTQYRKQGKRVDSLAAGLLTKWVAYLGLPYWRIVLRADTLPEGMVAQTQISEHYRNALVVKDLRALDDLNTEEALLHEVWHIKLAPYTSLVRQLVGVHEGFLSQDVAQREERLVTDLTRGMLWRKGR